jgi:tetratricopeptide (TPR) repeat protein
MKIRLTILAIGLLLCAGTLFAQSAAELYERYSQAEKAGDWSAAEKIARQGVAKFPAEKGFVTSLAWALRHEKKYTEALAAIEPAFRKNPTEPSLRDNYAFALVDRGWELSGKKEYAQALDLFARARALLPDDQWVVNGYGYALVLVNRKEEGIALLERGLKAFPDNASLKANLTAGLLSAGWDFFNAGERIRALEYFDRAAAIVPDDEWVLNARGVGLRDAGRLDEGIGVLEQGRGRNPGNANLGDNLVWAYILKAEALMAAVAFQNLNVKSDWPPVEAWFAKAAAINDRDRSYLAHYGLFLMRTNRADEALALFVLGEKLYPGESYFTEDWLWAMLARGRACLNRREFDAAIAIIGQVRARFSDEAWFLVDLADAWFGKADYNRSAQALVELAGLAKPRENRKPFTGDQRELVYFRLMRLAWKFAETRDYAAGLALVDRLAKIWPDAFFISEARGVLVYQRGDTAQGIALVNNAYERYVAEHPETKVTLELDLPLSGIIWVGGNNRPDAITHAGLNRFCYDFMGSNEKGETLKPGIAFPGISNADYLGFGADIICPVDGVVEEVVDRYDDLVPRAVPTPADGNSVTIKDDRGYHYLFVHNKKGSVKVIAGQRVKKGAKLAEMGNNGYSGQPHLHFGVYTPDWRVSVQVKFTSYRLFKDGKVTDVAGGVPATGDVIER